jgi:hypothetical protein
VMRRRELFREIIASMRVRLGRELTLPRPQKRGGKRALPLAPCGRTGPVRKPPRQGGEGTAGAAP